METKMQHILLQIGIHAIAWHSKSSERLLNILFQTDRDFDNRHYSVAKELVSAFSSQVLLQDYIRQC